MLLFTSKIYFQHILIKFINYKKQKKTKNINQELIFIKRKLKIPLFSTLSN